MPGRTEITRLLDECGAGNAEAFERLIPLVYGDRRRIAHRRLRAEPPGQSLRITTLLSLEQALASLERYDERAARVEAYLYQAMEGIFSNSAA